MLRIVRRRAASSLTRDYVSTQPRWPTQYGTHEGLPWDWKETFLAVGITAAAVVATIWAPNPYYKDTNPYSRESLLSIPVVKHTHQQRSEMQREGTRKLQAASQTVAEDAADASE